MASESLMIDHDDDDDDDDDGNDGGGDDDDDDDDDDHDGDDDKDGDGDDDDDHDGGSHARLFRPNQTCSCCFHMRRHHSIHPIQTTPIARITSNPPIKERRWINLN